MLFGAVSYLSLKGKKMSRKATVRQTAFGLLFDGNVIETARKAKYSGSNNALCVAGLRCLKNPHVIEIIRERGQLMPGELPPIEKRSPEIENSAIADRIEREEFYTSIMRNARAVKVVNELAEEEVIKVEVDVKDRIKAAEMLGKIQGDFMGKGENVERTHEEWLKMLDEIEGQENEGV